jgi:hexosaminidase
VEVNALDSDWNSFESKMPLQLRSLEQAGIMYRLAPPGAQIADGMLQANSEFPGQTIEYRTDGTGWTRYTAPVWVSGKVELRTRTFDGRRTSRIVEVTSR